MLRRKAFKAFAYKILFRPLLTFIFLYVFKLGMLDGRPGFHFSLMRSFYEYQIDLKMNELNQPNNEGRLLDINRIRRLHECLNIKKMQKRGKASQRFNISEATYRSAQSFLQRLILRLRQYIIYPIQLAIHLFVEAVKGNGKRPSVVATNTFFAPCWRTSLIVG